MIIAALADLHCTTASRGQFAPVFKEISEKADVMLLGGDLTNHGQIEEAKIFAGEMKEALLPTFAVLGNHDFEADQAEDIKKIITSERVILLDGTCAVIDRVGFAGTKGFAGGFAPHHLPSLGEKILKEFTAADIAETLKLETALAELETKIKIALLHYAPITGTIEGESLEVYPLLGSSRLAEPINTLGATVVFHGHSHHGKFEGKTDKGIPVFNVAMPILRRLKPPKSYLLFETKA